MIRLAAVFQNLEYLEQKMKSVTFSWVGQYYACQSAKTLEKYHPALLVLP